MMRVNVKHFVTFITIYLAGGKSATARPEFSKEMIIDPEELRNFTLPNLHLYENWVDWENWESTEETRKSFPYYRSGYDEDGLVVYVMEFGKWNYRALTHLSPEQIEDFWMYYEQCARRAERDSALRKNGGNVFLLDWDGFSLANYASGPALQGAMKTFTFLVRFNSVTKYGFHVNVNFAAETFINLAKPYFANLLEKMEIHGTRSEKWKPIILRKIPPNQLPPTYGGAKDWKPLPFH